MDKRGNMAMGYSVSSSSTYPSIRFAGRKTADTPGTMGQGEGVLVAGGGAQSATRYGDYSAMTVDPTDDCTFWYTTEYIKSSGTRNWHTRIGAFRFPDCGGVASDDFSLALAPSSRTLAPGEKATFAITTALTTGSAQSIALSVSGLPAGVAATFAPATIAAGSSSTLTLQAAANAAGVTGSFTVTATGAASTRTVGGSITVSSGDFANGGFELGTWDGWASVGTTKLRTVGARTGTYCARVGSLNGEAGDSSLSHTLHVPAAGTTTLSFYYQPHCADTVQWDQQKAEIKSSGGVTLKTLFTVCEKSDAWTKVTADLTPYASQDVAIVFGDHDDGNPADPTYLVVDDVQITHAP